MKVGENLEDRLPKFAKVRLKVDKKEAQGELEECCEMMEYSELRVAAGRLVILDEIKSCLKKSGANLTEHDLCAVERYLHHAVAIEFTFADRAAKRIVDERIVLPDSRCCPLRGYMATLQFG